LWLGDLEHVVELLLCRPIREPLRLLKLDQLGHLLVAEDLLMITSSKSWGGRRHVVLLRGIAVDEEEAVVEPEVVGTKGCYRITAILYA
jgi:hypothetical protein